MGIHERRSTGELGQFAHEATSFVRDDEGPAFRWVPLRDVDFAAQDDDDPRTCIAGNDDRFPTLIGADFPESARALDFFGFQHRKHLVASCGDDRVFGGDHLLFRSRSAH